MATVRRELRIQHPPEEVWAVVGDAGRIHEWFPGIVSCTVGDGVRTITTGTGITMDERIVTVDPILRRFQYSIQGGFFREHLSTVDVIDLEDGSSLAVYSTDAQPDVIALVVGGAAGAALHRLRDLLDGEGGDAAAGEGKDD